MLTVGTFELNVLKKSLSHLSTETKANEKNCDTSELFTVRELIALSKSRILTVSWIMFSNSYLNQSAA